MIDEHFCKIMWNQVHERAENITSNTIKTAFKSLVTEEFKNLVTEEPLRAIVL